MVYLLESEVVKINEYTLKELCLTLDRGGEIDFIYMNDKFSISQSDGEIILTKHTEPDKYQSFKSSGELIRTGLISNESFKETWSRAKVTLWF